VIGSPTIEQIQVAAVSGLVFQSCAVRSDRHPLRDPAGAPGARDALQRPLDGVDGFGDTDCLALRGHPADQTSAQRHLRCRGFLRGHACISSRLIRLPHMRKGGKGKIDPP